MKRILLIFLITAPLLTLAQQPEKGSYYSDSVRISAAKDKYLKSQKKQYSQKSIDSLRSSQRFDVIRSTIDLLNTDYATASRPRIDPRYEGFRGTPFLVPSWEKGELWMADGKRIKDVPMKYDALHKEVWIMRSPTDSIVVNSDQLKGFRLFSADRSNSYSFLRVDGLKAENGELLSGFLLVLHEGKATLMKYVNKEIKPADFKDQYSTGRRYDQFVDRSSYYLRLAEGGVRRIKPNARSVADAFGDREALIRDFIRQENLDVKNDGDLVKVMRYFDAQP
ncbi:MAG: hypothetical protein LH606_19270 [Cytophagaceae bacterium]|nr:hypothetical protein [Cytophagaceae bacterium]